MQFADCIVQSTVQYYVVCRCSVLLASPTNSGLPNTEDVEAEAALNALVDELVRKAVEAHVSAQLEGPRGFGGPVHDGHPERWGRVSANITDLWSWKYIV